MALTTSLAGRVKNTSLPKSHALLPLLEAVVNSIQAIDELRNDSEGSGRIVVSVRRDTQGEFALGPVGTGRPALKPILGFTVKDDGIGFTTANMSSFETLDSDFKAHLGCRGVGRLLWLKAFDRVAVSSAYLDESGELKGRQFRFSIDHEVEREEAPVDFSRPGSSVSLLGFKPSFQENAPKSVEVIAREIFEHCVWYFLRPGGAPDVVVTDGDDTVRLGDLLNEFAYEDMTSSRISVGDQPFDLLHLRLKGPTRVGGPKLFWCAANRVVSEDNLSGKIPGLYARLKEDGAGEFTYVCYLSGDYLDENVRSDRTGFDLTDRLPGAPLFSELTLDDIREAVLDEVKTVLGPHLEAVQSEGKERLRAFVSDTNPRYRPLLGKFEERAISIDPTIKDNDLELLLHKEMRQIEQDVMRTGHAIFAEGLDVPDEEHAERLNEYLATLTEMNMSDLAAYVSRRRSILDYLDRLIRVDSAGKYSREEAIHSLLIPMRTESNDLPPEGSNLWIVDERLAFHDFLASDKTLKSMPITGSMSTTEPDVLATRIIDGPVLAAEGNHVSQQSLVVVEIKRPMRNDATEGKDPIQQCLGYIKKIRAGGQMTVTGRPIPGSQEAPAFCYVIADLSPTMIDRCEYAGLQRTHDGLGYFGFNAPTKAYIEVISFDGLLKAANERNRAFFDKLGLPTA